MDIDIDIDIYVGLGTELWYFYSTNRIASILTSIKKDFVFRYQILTS